MLDFRAAHLPNKYWSRGSVVVPSTPMVLDERFKPLNDLYLDHDKREAFDIYWIEQGIAGNVILPGELNYAYINGKYYHLEKVSNQGIFNNGGHADTEWGYYLEYDDWQNEWLRNGIHLEGTISKTGDYRTAKENIIQLAPLITGCNNYKFYLSGADGGERVRIINYTPPRNNEYIFCPDDIKEFNRLLNNIVSQRMETAERTRLRIPLVLRPCSIHNPNDFLINKVYEFLQRPDLKVFDVKKNVLNFAAFKTKNKINQVYCITTKEYHTFEVAETENQHARVKNQIDFLKYGNEIEHLNTDLTVIEKQGDKTLDDIVEKYLKRYPNITSTRDKGEIKFIACEEIFTTFAPILIWKERDWLDVWGVRNLLNPSEVYGEPKWINIYKSGVWETHQLKDYHGLERYPSERLLSINGIYQPGTNPKDIYIIGEVGGPEEWRAGEKIEIAKRFPAKTPAAWWASKTWDELKAWLRFNNSKGKINIWNFLPDGEVTSGLDDTNGTNGKLKGNLLINQWAKYTNIDEHKKSIYLIPDYRSRGWVLGESNWTIDNNLFSTRVLTTWARGENSESFDDHQIIREIGLIDANRQTTWLHPQTDTILNNDNKLWSKYALIIPLMVRWNRGYNWAYDSYGYRFFYEFTQQRWKTVKEAGSNTYESKRFNLLFQFPLSGCGFDIYEILKEYKDLNDKYLRWNFICSDEYKTKQKWEDKGGQFEHFFDIGANSNNEPINREDRNKNDHGLFNEGIEIRIYTRAGASINRVMELVFKLWVYYYGWRWDGSYNGAVLLNNHGSEKESGFLKITWAKPFNRRWYMCGLWLNNYYGDKLTLNKERLSNGALLYGKGSPRWNPLKYVRAIGYQYAHDMTGPNIDAVKHILTSNCQEIELKINTDGDYEKIDTFQTNHIPPVKFSHLLLGDKPWENIKFNLDNWPTEYPFGHFTLGKRLKDVVRDMTYTTNRTINPTYYNPWTFKPVDNIKLTNWGTRGNERLIKLEKEEEPYTYKIPFFIYSVIDPDNISSKFKHLNFTGTVEESKKNFRSLLQQELQNALTTLNTRPFIFDLKGSEFIAIAKINVNSEMEIELISKSNASIESVDAKEYTFNNPTQAPDTFEEFIRRLSSQFEISIFGQRIPIKTRPDTTGGNIDIGLKITPINDPKQSNTSLWYMVEIKTTQDTQRMRIEVPKELNAMNIQNAYEREHMIRTLAYHNRDRQLENLQQKDEISKYSFDIDLKGRRIDINRNKEMTSEIIGMAQTAIQASQAMGISGWFGGGAAIAAGGMATGMAGQVANMVYSKQLYNLDKQEHLYHAALGEAALMRRGETTRNKHELAEQADKLKLYNMQTNINYPANTDALMFREENKQMNLTDVHLTQYYPDGELLRFLVDYYKEYGFNVIVPNQRCFGIDWITGHIQFVKITNNVHPNETIRRMIEERALRGVTLERNDDWHADRVQDLTGDYSISRD